jgi:hypothetical protein
VATKTLEDSDGISHTVYLWNITSEMKERAAKQAKRKAKAARDKKGRAKKKRAQDNN